MPTLDDVAWPRRTARLLIRRATETDAASCWRYCRLPEVGEWITTAAVDEADFTERFVAPDRLPTRLVVEQDGTVVGDLTVKVRDAWSQSEVAERAAGVEAELGWIFDPAVHGRGYATEVVTALVAIAFADLGLRRVVAECFAANTPSMRVMERVGMRREADNVADSLHRTRGWLDGVTYALLADEWRARVRSA